MGMLLLEDHQPVVSASLIEQLPQLLTQHCHTLDCAVFFATPRLAHLFSQGSDFLTKALSHVYQAGRPDVSRSCVVGIVDKLPGAWHVHHEKVNSSEGLAFMATQRQMVITEDTKASESLPLICLSSSRAFHRCVTNLRVIALPVANTLFVNGRHSTLFRQEWTTATAETSQDVVSHPQDSQTLLQSVTIDTALGLPRTIISTATRVPLVSLTEPRAIKTVMGNIVRDIEVADKSEPASVELEEAVMKSAQDDSKKDIKVQIFALLQEPGAAHEETFTQRQLLSRARLHKVTGGGGGWGQKRGLLSLDPNQVHPNEEEQSLSFVESLGGDSMLRDQQTKAIAKAGESIQFFRYRDPSHHDYSDHLPLARGRMTWRSERAEDHVIFDYLAGTIPTQDLPVSLPSSTTNDELAQGTPSVIPDHFGILSEGRLDVRQYKHETDLSTTSLRVSTSIDVPNTLFNFHSGHILRKPQSQDVAAKEPKKKKSTDPNVSPRPAARRNPQESSKEIQTGNGILQSRAIRQVLSQTAQSSSPRAFRRLNKDLSGPQEITFQHDVPAPGDRIMYQDLSDPRIEASQPEPSSRRQIHPSSGAHGFERSETGPGVGNEIPGTSRRIRKHWSSTNKFSPPDARRPEEGETGLRIRRTESLLVRRERRVFSEEKPEHSPHIRKHRGAP